MPKPAKRAALTLPALSVALGSAAFLSAAGEELPSRIKIAAWGENLMRGSKVKFFVNEQTVEALRTQAARGYDGVPGDYEHQSVAGHPGHKPAPIEFWARKGRVEAVPGDGLFYLPGEYTESGRKYAANYQDVSGVFNLDKKTKAVIAVRSVALTEHGQVDGAEFVQAAVLVAAAMGAGAGGYGREECEQLITYVRELLEVNEDATVDDLTTGLEAMVRAKNDPSQTQSQTKTKKTMDAEIKAAFDAQNEQIKGLTGSLTTLTASLQGLSDNQVVANHNAAVEVQFLAASQKGIKVPDSLKKKDEKTGRYLTSPEVVQEVCSVIPPTIETAFTTPGVVTTAASVAAEKGRDEVIMASLGLSKEQWEKPCPMKHGLGLAEEKKALQTAA